MQILQGQRISIWRFLCVKMPLRIRSFSQQGLPRMRPHKADDPQQRPDSVYLCWQSLFLSPLWEMCKLPLWLSNLQRRQLSHLWLRSSSHPSSVKSSIEKVRVPQHQLTGSRSLWWPGQQCKDLPTLPLQVRNLQWPVNEPMLNLQFNKSIRWKQKDLRL